VLAVVVGEVCVEYVASPKGGAAGVASPRAVGVGAPPGCVEESRAQLRRRLGGCEGGGWYARGPMGGLLCRRPVVF